MSNLPTVTSSIPRDLRNFVDRLRDLVNGGGAGRLITAKELVDAGIANIDSRGELSPTTETISLGPPPAPTNVAASAAIQNVIVTWDLPEYPTHAYAEVWGADTDDIGAAVLIGQSPGAIYTDSLGPDKTRYYWVRFVNTQFTTGPYNATLGTPATTGADLAYTMDVLADAYGSTSEAPFFQLDAPQVIGGVTVPAGTYMKAAFIYDGVITNAKIANAAIDDAKIASLSADKLTAGTVSADVLSSTVINAKVTNIDTAVIQSGLLNIARIADGSITNAKIKTADISFAKMDTATINSLSAIKANMGDITAGNIKFTDPNNSGNYIIIDGATQNIRVYSNSVLRVKIGNLA